MLARSSSHFFLCLLFSPRCKTCGKATKQTSRCFSCWRAALNSLSGEQHSYLFSYEQPTSNFIRGLRRDDSQQTAEVLVRFLEKKNFFNRWQEAKYDLVVWAPTNHRFSGIDYLGTLISKRIKSEWDANLFRKHANYAQHSKRRAARMDMPGLAKLGQEKCVRGKRVLILDDVSTTGTTLHYSAYLLRKNGAAFVDTFALSRKEIKNRGFS